MPEGFEKEERGHGRALPARFEDVLTRCLRKDRDDRYRDVTELREALESLSPGRRK
jgi:hypothetical protein